MSRIETRPVRVENENEALGGANQSGSYMPTVWELATAVVAMIAIYGLFAEFNHDISVSGKLAWTVCIVASALTSWKLLQLGCDKLVDGFIAMYEEGENGYITPHPSRSPKEKKPWD